MKDPWRLLAWGRIADVVVFVSGERFGNGPVGSIGADGALDVGIGMIFAPVDQVVDAGERLVDGWDQVQFSVDERELLDWADAAGAIKQIGMGLRECCSHCK